MSEPMPPVLPWPTGNRVLVRVTNPAPGVLVRNAQVLIIGPAVETCASDEEDEEVKITVGDNVVVDLTGAPRLPDTDDLVFFVADTAILGIFP